MRYKLTLEDLTHEDLARVTNLLNGDINTDVVENVSVDTINEVTEANQNAVNAEEPILDNVPVANGEIEHDIHNLPWDERIHAGSKTKNKDGSWKAKRGVSDELKKQVEAELKGEVITPVVEQPTVAPQAVAPVVEQPTVAPQAAAPVVEQPTVAPQAVAPVNNGQVDFAGLVGKIAELSQSGKVQATYVNELCQKIGASNNLQINSLTDISARPDLINFAAQIMQSEGNW